jgi:hypothetical protein
MTLRTTPVQATRRRLTALVAVATLAAGLAIAIPTSASAATIATPATGHATAVRGYSHGQISVQMTITNSSNQVWTLDPAETMHSGGHWAQQAATTLQPGAQTTVSAYTDSPADWLGWYVLVTYQISDGHFATFQTVEGNVLPNVIEGGWATKVDAQAPSADWITSCPMATGSIGPGYHPSGQISLATCAAA